MAKQMMLQARGMKSAVRTARNSGNARRKKIVKDVKKISKATEPNINAAMAHVGGGNTSSRYKLKRQLQAKAIKLARGGKRRSLGETKKMAKRATDHAFVRSMVLKASGQGLKI